MSLMLAVTVGCRRSGPPASSTTSPSRLSEPSAYDQKGYHLKAEAPACDEMRFRPHQERPDVLGILFEGLWGIVIEADLARLQLRRHCYDMSTPGRAAHLTTLPQGAGPPILWRGKREHRHDIGNASMLATLTHERRQDDGVVVFRKDQREVRL
jgi:hypothetical protein